MAILSSVPKQLAQGQLAASATTIYTAPIASGAKALIKEIILCNDDSSARTFTLYAVPNGQSVAATRLLFKTQSIAAGASVLISLNLILEASGFLSGLADSASKVTYTVSGVEATV